MRASGRLPATSAGNFGRICDRDIHVFAVDKAGADADGERERGRAGPRCRGACARVHRRATSGSSAAATPGHDQVVAAIIRRARMEGMLLSDAQKHAPSLSSSALPTYHALVNAIPRRCQEGSASSASTTARPAWWSANATAEPTSPQPSTMATGCGKDACLRHWGEPRHR